MGRKSSAYVQGTVFLPHGGKSSANAQGTVFLPHGEKSSANAQVHHFLPLTLTVLQFLSSKSKLEHCNTNFFSQIYLN
jgi:hypothetical protein